MDIESVKVTIERITDWTLVHECAMATIGREAAKDPSSSWKARLCRCEHSPLRAMKFKITVQNLPSFVSVHFVRHKFGIEHFVQSQRVDRSATHTPRSELPQDAPVMHKMVVNASEMIFISRRRLCSQASAETRAVWRKIVEALASIEPEIAAACVPECIYRGFCPEFRSCGYTASEKYKRVLSAYRNPGILQVNPMSVSDK